MSQSLTLSLLALAAIALADSSITSPPSYPSTCSVTVCADYINSCGQTYGGCYPACTGYATPSFSDPGCPHCSLTACEAHSNSCGQSYGGCYPACSGYTTPSFTDPGCPTITTPLPESPSCSVTLCADSINSCGQWYGGCYPACSPYTAPTFTDPGCPPTTKSGITGQTTTRPVTTTCTSSTVKSPSKPSTTPCTASTVKSPPKPSTTSKPCSTTCTETLCQDYVNSCGSWYGGCFPVCTGYTTPVFTDPGCPTTTSVSTRQ